MLCEAGLPVDVVMFNLLMTGYKKRRQWQAAQRTLNPNPNPSHNSKPPAITPNPQPNPQPNLKPSPSPNPNPVSKPTNPAPAQPTARRRS